MTRRSTREHRGRRANLSGKAAEEIAQRHYLDRGACLQAERWRGQGGEIDLIAEDGDTYVFVEVKSSKSFDQAAESLTQRQMQRIMLAAQEYVGRLADGLLSNMRFDVALVNGRGELRVIENAFGQ